MSVASTLHFLAGSDSEDDDAACDELANELMAEYFSGAPCSRAFV